MNVENGTSVLEVEGLNVSYGSFKAVCDVSFDVKAGEIFGLLGPNGAGKTSTLSAVEGLLKPQSGSIHISGFDAKKNGKQACCAIGYDHTGNGRCFFCRILF